MISNMSRPAESDLFATFPSCDRNMMGIGRGPSGGGDPYAPISVGSRRGSGTGSPSSLDGASSSLTNGVVEDSKSFPIILHAIVSDESTDDAIHWLPCGTRFVIANKDIFSRDILPRYFGSRGGSATKFTSFTRRLKRWNFSRVPSGREMGAYYHESFRRGEAEMAQGIMYPVGKGSINKGQPSAKGGNKGGNKKSPPTIPKARRRASTGMMPSFMPGSGEMTPLDDFALNISPAPIKDPIGGLDEDSILPLPFLEPEMNNWLSSAEFNAEGPSPHVTPSINSQPPAAAASVVSDSSSFLLPPPAFPNSALYGGIQGGEAGGISQRPMLMRPGAMRRHSTTMENLNVPNMMSLSMMAHGGGPMNPANPSLLLGTNFGTHPEMVASSANNDLANGMFENTLSPRPEHPGSGNKLGDSLHSLSREFSFEDLKMIDPFT